MDHLRGLCRAARQRIPTLTEAVTGWKRKVAQRRRTLEWSEVISLVVENNIGDEATWWKVAKKQQTDQGDALMINYVDRLRGKQGGLQKAISDAWRHHRAINGEAILTETCLYTTTRYPFESFVLSEAMHEWVREGHKSKALVLEGPGGIGKTQLAMALLLRVRPKVFFIDDYEQINRCHWTGFEGVLFDDVCMRHKSIDECKALFDMDWSRVVKCRYENGLLPEGTPRIFSTNHTRALFFPRDYNLAEHQHPINRRMLWLHVTRCILDEQQHKKQAAHTPSHAGAMSGDLHRNHVAAPIDLDRTQQHEAYSSEDDARRATATRKQPVPTCALAAKLPIKTEGPARRHPLKGPPAPAVPTHSPLRRLQDRPNHLDRREDDHNADAMHLIMQSLAALQRLHRTGLRRRPATLPVRRRIAKKQGPPLAYFIERFFKAPTGDTQALL